MKKTGYLATEDQQPRKEKTQMKLFTQETICPMWWALFFSSCYLGGGMGDGGTKCPTMKYRDTAETLHCSLG